RRGAAAESKRSAVPPRIQTDSSGPNGSSRPTALPGAPLFAGFAGRDTMTRSSVKGSQPGGAGGGTFGGRLVAGSLSVRCAPARVSCPLLSPGVGFVRFLALLDVSPYSMV